MNKNLRSTLFSLGAPLRALLCLLLFSGASSAAYNTGQFLTATSDTNSYTATTLGPNGVFYGAWRLNSAAEIKIATYNGSTWTESAASFTGANVASQLPGFTNINNLSHEGLAVDSSGNIHIVFPTAVPGTAGARGLAYGKYSGNSWTFRKLFIVQNADGYRTLAGGQYSLKLDANQNPHVVFVWSDATVPRRAELKYAFYNGAQWNVTGDQNALDGQLIYEHPTAYSNNEGVGDPSSTFDATGNLHVAFIGKGTANSIANIYYAKKAVGGSTFSPAAVAAEVSNATRPSIVVNSSNVVSIGDTYLDGSTVKYRVTTNSSGSFTNSVVGSFALTKATKVKSIGIMGINSSGRRVLGALVGSHTSNVYAENQFRIFYETGTNVWAEEAMISDYTSGPLQSPSMVVRPSDNRVMVLYGQQVTGGARTLRYAEGVPAGYGGSPTPNLSINDVTLNEGNAGTTSFSFTVSLSSPAPVGGVTFDIATANGTAAAPGDYTAKSLTGQTIPAGSSTYAFTVLVNGDTALEPNENFFVNVTNVTGANVADGQGQGTITNDDVDTTPPDTTLTATPTHPTKNATSTFTFTGSDDVGVTSYEVRIDTGGWTAATSPYTTGVLGDGSHTFSVRAKDAAGNVDPTPASFTFTVDTTPPDTIIVSGPPALTNSSNATFGFSSSESPVFYEMSLDGGAYSTATNPLTFTGLSSGNHTLAIRAVDGAGNVDPTPATYSWIVDNTPPAAPVVITPANGSRTNSTKPTISGTAEANSTVTVIVDGSSAGTASANGAGVWTFAPASALAEGSHTVRSVATDAAGNTSASSNTNTFTVDTIAPVAPVLSSPADGSSIAFGMPTFTGVSEEGSTVNVTVDGVSQGTATNNGSGSWTFSSTSDLAEGSHTVSVTATDAAGNTSTPSQTYTFIVDLTRPTVVLSSTATDPAPFGGFTLTVQFSEEVTGFEIDDLVVTHATKSDFVQVDGDTYTVFLTPTAPGVTVTANLPEWSAADRAGHPSTAADPFSIVVIDKAVSITADHASLAEGTGSGSTAFGFTVSRVGPTTGPVTVNYAVTGSGVNQADASDFGGTLPSGSVTIPDGAVSVPLFIYVTKDASKERDEEFTVTLSGPDNDYVLGTASAASTIVNDDSEADLSITVTDGVATAVPGGSVTYTITVLNAGPDPVSGATVADTFPAALTATWIAAGGGGGTVASLSGSGNINTTVNLPVGASVTFTVTANINASATGALSNTATVTPPAGVTDPTPANNSATDTNTLTAQADLAITVTDGVTTATPGGNVTYTIIASNAGPSNASGVTVSDIFPAALTTTWTAVGAGGGTATASGSGNIHDTVNLPAGGSVTYTVTAAISPSATGTLSNTATVTAPPGLIDPTPGNNSATDTDTLTAQADLAITVTDGVTTATPGGSVTYTITVSNAGPSHASGVTVVDTFPAALTATWTAVGAGGGTATASGSGNIHDTVNLPAGGSVTYTVTATISPSATGTLSNTATVSGPPGLIDPTPGNNSATDTNTLTPTADLAITVTDGATSAIPGNSVTYTITASNAGPGDVTGATVTDTFPASLEGVTWTAVANGGATVTPSGSGDISEIINLPAGSSVTFTVSATLSPSATGTLSNTATVNPPIGVIDTDPANNSGTDTNTLSTQADVAVSLTDSPDPVQAGENITYTVTLTNIGPSNAHGVSASLPLPEGVTFVSAGQSTNAGFRSDITTPAIGGTGTVTMTPVTESDIGFGTGSISYTVVGRVGYVGNGTVISATATVSSDTTDPNSANNSATSTTTVNAAQEIALHNGGSTTDAQITDGQVTQIDFGTTNVNAALITRSFTIANTGNDTLSVSAIALPTGFSLVNPFIAQMITPNATFSFQVRYDAAAIGTASGDIVIANNDADESPFNFPITATRANVAPVAVPQELTIEEDEVKAIVLAGSDADEQPITFAIVDQPQHGTLTGTARNVTYTPDTDYNGTDAFSFKVNDGTVDSSVVEINLIITPVNDAPKVVGAGIPDQTQIRPNLPGIINLVPFFSDAETASASLIYTVQAPAEAQAVVTGSLLQINGSISGAYDITVNAADSDTLNVSDTFTLTVKRVPQLAGAGVPPTLVSPSEPTFDLDLAGYFTDGDGDALGYAIINNSDTGVLAATLTGSTVTIVPVSPGVASLTVRVTDSDGNFIDHTFEVTIDDPIPDSVPTVSSPPKLNRQTGLWEISLTATNNNIFNVPGFRFRVTSALPSHVRLYNSTAPIGSSEAYLDVLDVLTPGQSITVVLEFHSTTRDFAGFDPTIIAEPLPEGTSNAGTGEGLEINRFVNLADGSKLIEFSSIAGRWYEVHYSSDLVTWKRSLVPVQAGANFTQWIDRGAPYTESHPSTVPCRFYRVAEILPR